MKGAFLRCLAWPGELEGVVWSLTWFSAQQNNLSERKWIKDAGFTLEMFTLARKSGRRHVVLVLDLLTLRRKTVSETKKDQKQSQLLLVGLRLFLLDWGPIQIMLRMSLSSSGSGGGWSLRSMSSTCSSSLSENCQSS